MSASAHARYRPRLQALAQDALFEGVLPAGADWQRRYARFHPDDEPFAVLTFESSDSPDCVVRVDAYTGDVPHAIRTAAGWLRPLPFDHDDCLSTLPVVLAQPGRWTVARYLPRRRCTLRLETAHQPPRYLKVYRDERGERAHDAGTMLWRHASEGQLAFDVPTPEDWDPGTRTLRQLALPGGPIADALYGEGGAAMARRIGFALGSLSQSGAAPTRLFDATAQLKRSVDLGVELGRRVPLLADRVGRLLDQLTVLHQRVGARDPRPIHGDPHADQWLDHGERLGLVDFESLALGDPELDAAVFLAELDFEDRRVLPVLELEAAYVAGAAAAGLTLDPHLLRVYRAHKRLAKALRSASSLREDGDRRAEVHLGLAMEYLNR